MKSVHLWFDEYGESHQDHTNKALHWVCIPLIMFGLLGLLWKVPLHPAIEWSELANVATVFMALALLYYLRLSLTLAIGMALASAAMVGGLIALDRAAWAPLWQISLGVFVVAWIGQFIGHKVEGKKPSFFQDLQFLLIGPLWLLGFIYRRLGIPYIFLVVVVSQGTVGGAAADYLHAHREDLRAGIEGLNAPDTRAESASERIPPGARQARRIREASR